jgi:DNA-binding transcriptional LysR family regulator
MNVQHLRYFITVMETGSVSRAAGALGITQPTLSAALKRLEIEFGTKLFAPHGRGIRPLPGAKLLEERIRPALRALSEAKRDLSGVAPAAVKFGLLQSLAETWAPALAGGNYECPIEITEGLPAELERKLLDGAIDAALSTMPIQRGLQGRPLFNEPYLLFTSPTHPLAGRQTLHLQELNLQPFVMRQSCERLANGHQLFEAARMRVKVVARTRQESTAAALVAAGIGCTIAAKSWRRQGLRAIKIVGFSLDRTIAVIWKTKDKAALAASLIRKIEELAAARHSHSEGSTRWTGQI